ncbi:MAG: hypothetical protein KAG61_02265 [Bacteriovoracaceae bacterium]|nr:hypothetical protein [Bacteriovoracaceae bacterium]
MKRLNPQDVIDHLTSYIEIDPEDLVDRTNSMVEMLHKSAKLKSSFQIFDIDWSEERVAVLKTDLVLIDREVIRTLSDCPQVAVTLSTLGEIVDIRSREMNGKDALNGMIFDLAASQLLEICTHELHAKIDSLAKSEGLSTTCALTPRPGDFSMEYIPAMLKAVNSERHGVTCEEGYEFFPHKSEVSLIGLCRSELTEDPFMAEVEFPENIGLDTKSNSHEK